MNLTDSIVYFFLNFVRYHDNIVLVNSFGHDNGVVKIQYNISHVANYYARLLAMAPTSCWRRTLSIRRARMCCFFPWSWREEEDSLDNYTLQMNGTGDFYTPCSPSTSSPRWSSSIESQTHVYGNLWSASSHWWSEGDKQLINHKTLMANGCYMIQYNRQMKEQWSNQFAQIAAPHTHLDNGEKGFGVVLWVLQNVIYKRELEDACLKNYG